MIAFKSIPAPITVFEVFYKYCYRISGLDSEHHLQRIISGYSNNLNPNKDLTKSGRLDLYKMNIFIILTREGA